MGPPRITQLRYKGGTKYPILQETHESRTLPPGSLPGYAQALGDAGTVVWVRHSHTSKPQAHLPLELSELPPLEPG